MEVYYGKIRPVFGNTTIFGDPNSGLTTFTEYLLVFRGTNFTKNAFADILMGLTTSVRYNKLTYRLYRCYPM